MDEKTARKLSLELMEIAEAAILTTIDYAGFPQTRAMLNLRRKEQYPGLVEVFAQHVEDFLIYFTTNTSSSKMEQIKKNPNVSVYYSKPRDWRGLMLGGKIEIVTSQEIKESLWQEGWEMYYPGGVSDQDYTILSLRPVSAKYYHQLNFARIDFTPEP
ncbi:MAG: pyridoxamine 5'-phosphate oxidase family protein [Clostridia bacterium]|nr:pyridoxamine 5'-phosphate oxidase family protein [Clostridia bacterium]